MKKLQTVDRLEAELRQSLRSFEPEEVDRVIAHLKARNILDDRRTVQNLIQKRSGKRAVGAERLREELLARGAPEAIVDECLASEHDNATNSMRAALAGKFSPEGDRAKGARFLLSRGFDEVEIEGALDDFFRSE